MTTTLQTLVTCDGPNPGKRGSRCRYRVEQTEDLEDPRQVDEALAHAGWRVTPEGHTCPDCAADL